MKRTARIALTLAVCGLGTACNTLTIQPTRAINAMDTTMGTYQEADAGRYIIVTMTDTVFDQLVQGERVDREAELPPLYARFLGQPFAHVCDEARGGLAFEYSWDPLPRV
jgi:hypothetical protein